MLFRITFLMLIGIPASAQLHPDTVLDSARRLQTDIFILDNCIPTQLSIVRMYDNNKKEKSMPVRRLSIPTKKFSAFKIININPLRYSFFINNELVTQFFDNTAFPANNNSFLRGDYLPVQDIQKLEIFKTDFEISNKKEKLRDLKLKIKALQDSIELFKDDINNSYSLVFELTRGYDSTAHKPILFDDKQEAYEAAQSSIGEKRGKIKIKQRELSALFRDFEAELSSLTINNRNFNILGNYTLSRYNLSNDSTEGLGQIINNIQNFSKKYRQMQDSFDLVSTLLTGNNVRILLSGGSIYSKEEEALAAGEFDRIKNILVSYGLVVNWPPGINNGYSLSVDMNTTLEMDIKEFIINKKYQDYESFLVSISADAGKLLQNKFIEYSQLLNMTTRNNCLLRDNLPQIDSIRKKLVNTFHFIQDMSADFSVIVRHLDLDNRGFKDIVNNINKYYVELLNFLKYFDMLVENNTIEFTLPTHTNLKNVDLIRYKVDREDKITKSKQTYVYDLWLKGGLKIDFSVGMFRSELQDREYEKSPFYNAAGILSQDTIAINRRDKGDADFAFGGMVNISPRVGASWVNGGVSFGVIYSTNQKLQFISSLSLHLGKTERISLHYGWAMGFAQSLDRSKNNFTLNPARGNNDFMVRGNLEDFNIPYVDKFIFKPFFGLSYNLSRRNTFQAVSNKGYETYNNLSSGAGNVTTPSN